MMLHGRAEFLAAMILKLKAILIELSFFTSWDDRRESVLFSFLRGHRETHRDANAKGGGGGEFTHSTQIPVVV